MVPADLVVNDGAASPLMLKSILLAFAPFKKSWACPSPPDLVETTWPVIVPPVSGSLVPSASVISPLPSNATPLMFLDVCKVLAVVALPLSAAVMVPAENPPLASLATMALAVLAFVAVVAELDTLPAVAIVASIALDTVPVSPVVISVPFSFGRV